MWRRWQNSEGKPYNLIAIFQGLSFVGKLGDDPVEFLELDGLAGGGLLVDVGAVEHLEQLVVVEVLVELLGDGLELFEIDGAVLVLVVDGEHAAEAVLGLGFTNLRADDAEELFEADWLVLVSESVDEREDEGVPLVEAQLLEDLVDLTGVDGAASVLVEHLEGALQFVVVLGGEAIFPGKLGGGLGGLGGLRLGCSAHKICIN